MHTSEIKNRLREITDLTASNDTLEQGENWLNQVVRKDTIDLELVQALIKKGVNPNIIDITDGKSPLHVAVEKSRLDVIKYLLNAGANPNMATAPIEETQRPLARHIARDIAGRLRRSAGGVLTPEIFGPIERVNYHQTEEGDTPLHIAARLHKPATVDLLLENGAHPNRRNSKKDSPLDAALANFSQPRLIGVSPTVEALLKGGAGLFSYRKVMDHALAVSIKGHLLPLSEFLIDSKGYYHASYDQKQDNLIHFFQKKQNDSVSTKDKLEYVRKASSLLKEISETFPERIELTPNSDQQQFLPDLKAFNRKLYFALHAEKTDSSTQTEELRSDLWRGLPVEIFFQINQEGKEMKARLLRELLDLCLTSKPYTISDPENNLPNRLTAYSR